MAFKHTGHSKSSRTLFETVPLGLRAVGVGSLTISQISVGSSAWGGSKNGLPEAILAQPTTSSPFLDNKEKVYITINQEIIFYTYKSCFFIKYYYSLSSRITNTKYYKHISN